MELRHIIFCVIIMLFGVLALAGCQKSEETHTVDWYKTSAHRAALTAKMRECINNPGELKNTPNCQNAQMATNQLGLLF